MSDNLLMLGNGFDLAHFFPTKYENFLHTTAFLLTYYSPAIDSVGKVFGDERLQDNSPFIKLCYERQKDSFDSTPLPQSDILFYIEKARSNLWFNYFLSSFSNELGWIDFEKEIANVVKAFVNFFEKNKQVFMWSEFNPECQHILRNFDFFFEREENPHHIHPKILTVRSDYMIEYPKNSRNVQINKEKIIDDLYSSLNDLADILKQYLKIFVDEPAHNKVKLRKDAVMGVIPDVFRVITFNYTQTFETIYGYTDSVKHIHGQTTENIVLGINPNINDELENIDTSFIKFKKYFQRIFYRTDDDYLNCIKEIAQNKKMGYKYSLFVIGHSLDITDEDIIKALFDLADNITIYYHDINAVGLYIKNLVTLYGKNGFDQLRVDKRCEFAPLFEYDVRYEMDIIETAEFK